MSLYPSYQYVRTFVLPMCLLGASLTASALDFTPSVPMNTSPNRTLGHPQAKLETGSPNLVEGRELNGPTDVVVDTNNKIVYVADGANNRVLGWKLSTLATGAFADYVIGQPDRFSTLAGGPNSQFKSGLIGPTALAVDGNGNLYVADAGNNRVIRYRQPFAQPAGELVVADFVIGQTSVNAGRDPNPNGRSAKTLFFYDGSNLVTTGMRFDSGGNLWVADPGNNRVLRYPASVLADGKPSGPEADLVIGQSSFTLAAAPADASSKITLAQPTTIAFDAAGRLFVGDAGVRVLVFVPGFSTGMAAQRIMGAPKQPAAGQPPLTPINQYTVGNGTTGPEGVFTIGNIPFVIDRAANRILRFPPFDQWQPESESFSPAAAAVIGQDQFAQTTRKVNRDLPEPGANRFFAPSKGFFADGKVYIADSGNNRVLVFPDLSAGPVAGFNDYTATTVLGQTDFSFGGVNLVEGREFNGPTGVAVFTEADGTPRLYVADTNNNRILGFADARKVKPGDRADIVIGQPDFNRVVRNYPLNSSTDRTASSIAQPLAVAVDKVGNLWVADTGNSRVLRFPKPFSPSFSTTADLVIGQSSFVSSVTDPTPRTMSAPSSLAFTAEGLLAVSDLVHNRVLVFIPPFSNGMAASRVIGQPNFSTTTTGTATDADKFNAPIGVSTDSDDRLYVADFNNNRVQVFARLPLLGDNPGAVFTIHSSQPHGLGVSKLTGEVWVLEGNGTRRFPKFDTMASVGDVPNYAITADTGGVVNNSFLSVAFDGFNNLYFGDGVNRITVYYPKVTICDGANFITRPLAPGMIVTASTPPGPSVCNGSADLKYVFTDHTRVFNELPNPVPLPRTIDDLQVLVDGVPAPLYYISPFQINFQMPANAPTSGTVEIQVVQPSTGRVFGTSTVPMATAAPAFFTLTFEQGVSSSQPAKRQAAILNEDNTVNSEKNPAVRGHFIQIFGTGLGAIPNMPTEGTPAPSDRALPTSSHVRVFVNTTTIEPNTPDVNYVGLTPGSIGLWQVNVKIPDNFPPGQAIVAVEADGVLSQTNQFGFIPTVWVK